MKVEVLSLLSAAKAGIDSQYDALVAAIQALPEDQNEVISQLQAQVANLQAQIAQVQAHLADVEGQLTSDEAKIAAIRAALGV